MHSFDSPLTPKKKIISPACLVSNFRQNIFLLKFTKKTGSSALNFWATNPCCKHGFCSHFEKSCNFAYIFPGWNPFMGLKVQTILLEQVLFLWYSKDEVAYCMQSLNFIGICYNWSCWHTWKRAFYFPYALLSSVTAEEYK